VEVLLARADTALYSAKDAGRDCCHAHDGQTCVGVEKNVAKNRRKSDCRHRIAPFADGSFPDADMFYFVNCEDVSALGFTFLSSEKPAYDKVLLALDDGAPGSTSATVQHCRNIGVEITPLPGELPVHRSGGGFAEPPS
jgi:hypothetical protein